MEFVSFCAIRSHRRNGELVRGLVNENIQNQCFLRDW